MGIHSHIAVQLSLIGQSQSHGSKSAYCPRSRGLCRRKLQRWLQLQLRPSELRLRLPQEGSRALLQPRPCLPPRWWLWIQQVRTWILLHRQEPPGSSCPQEVSPASDHLCPHPSWSPGSRLGSCWPDWSFGRQEVQERG